MPSPNISLRSARCSQGDFKLTLIRPAIEPFEPCYVHFDFGPEGSSMATALFDITLAEFDDLCHAIHDLRRVALVASLLPIDREIDS